MADNQNAEIFAANTLFVVLGTSVLTARVSSLKELQTSVKMIILLMFLFMDKAGLSMALGAFLAGLLLAETEFSLQVESDIAPYRGLLLGLFFMTVSSTLEMRICMG
jgi:Kef-type K+ transport system membrane component KefB